MISDQYSNGERGAQQSSVIDWTWLNQETVPREHKEEGHKRSSFPRGLALGLYEVLLDPAALGRWPVNNSELTHKALPGLWRAVQGEQRASAGKPAPLIREGEKKSAQRPGMHVFCLSVWVCTDSWVVAQGSGR